MCLLMPEDMGNATASHWQLHMQHATMQFMTALPCVTYYCLVHANECRSASQMLVW